MNVAGTYVLRSAAGPDMVLSSQRWLRIPRLDYLGSRANHVNPEKTAAEAST